MIGKLTKYYAKLIRCSQYRNKMVGQKELDRIQKEPRYKPLSTNILNHPLRLVDSLSFVASYKEIFWEEIYAFNTDNKEPFIIDGGSNIGLSIIYLKQCYPNSIIYGFEADPNVFEVLQSNIRSFKLNNVHLYNKALWNTETTLQFTQEGADAGRVARCNDNNNIKDIPTVRLRDYLDTTIDFLKLDIEGAETEAIIDCSDTLLNVKNLFIEYHSFVNEEQRLNELLSVIRKAGFRIQIHSQFSSPQPLIKCRPRLGMDLQLNLFGYRSCLQPADSLSGRTSIYMRGEK